jgi:hypothetical protein
MKTSPPRRRGLMIGGLLLSIALAAVILGVQQLAVAPVSGWIFLWVLLPVAGVPIASLLVYQLYCLATATYRLDRDGFYLRWGMLVEQIPLADIRGVYKASEMKIALRPRGGFRWPGYLASTASLEGGERIEFYSTAGFGGWVVLELDERYLVVSPPEPDAFVETFVDVTRMGSLEPIHPKTQRPDFLFGRIWSDALARGLLILGLALPLTLLGYLSFRISNLPALVSFGFSVDGGPALQAPPSRLLLLPLIGGLCWLIDGAAGVWLYRRSGSRVLSYVTWCVTGLVGALLWGAALQLLTAA